MKNSNTKTTPMPKKSGANSVSLRKFPYPYEAGLAICSDIDGTSYDNFISIHRFLNTSQQTEMGTGLSLPIGDSFWMYDKPQIANSAFSYFKDLQGTLSEHASVMRDFIRAGILDVMHSYGNFAAVHEFTRPLALQALEELDKHDLKVAVWTNHGGIESVHNIGANSFGLGDLPDSHFYHTDLLLRYGIRFYWDSEYSLMTNIGQDCATDFSDAYWNSPFYQTWKSRTRSLLKGVLDQADHLTYPTLKRHIIHWEGFDVRQNHLLMPEKLRDGNDIHKFKRVGLGRFDWSDDLPRLLNKNVVARLLQRNGYMILYVHLGDRRIKDGNLPLSDATISAFKNLARWYHDGKIWIATTAQLLKYNLFMKEITWNVEETADVVSINLQKIAGRDYTVEDFDGLTFYIPEGKRIELIYQQQPVKFSLNPADATAQKSITIPIRNIEWPL